MKARKLILVYTFLLMLLGACREGGDKAHVAKLSPAAYPANSNQAGYNPANGTSTVNDSVKQSKAEKDSSIGNRK